MSVVLCLFVLKIASTPWRHHVTVPYLGVDDFFYYLKIAQNIAAGHGSTFNGIVKTNGYHPLWLWCLAGAVAVTQHVGSLPVFLEMSVFLAAIATYLLANRFLHRGGMSALPASLAAGYVAVYSMHIYFYSMEVTLAVPLLLALLIAVQAIDAWLVSGVQGYLRSIGVGLLISVVVLSRLDTAIFVALLAIGIVFQSLLRQKIRVQHLFGVATGVLPLAAYLIANRLSYGVWEPVSGMAKQLKLDHGFTSAAWMSLLHKHPATLINLLPIIAALVVLPSVWRRLAPAHRVIAMAALSFPFVYLTALSWLSDWQLWDWYFYAFRPALCVSFMVLAQSARVRRVMQPIPIVVLSALFVFASLLRSEWPTDGADVLSAGLDLQQFALSHPGIYAMGDRSGVAGYLMDQPIIQTEGLVMDKAFLETIARQTPLRQVLADYHVRYYVGNSVKPYTGCFEAVEPFQAGVHAPHMRGEFCETPVAHWNHFGVETMVFDLKPETKR